MIITAMHFEPSIRCVAAVRYSHEVVSVIDDLLLESCSFDQRCPGISTMDWGIASCCRDGVPDVIWDTGSGGKGGLIRFFGEKPADVASNIIICSNRLIRIEL
jgi:hydroxymethylpyrimidine/phosphomethylpyrimidine kinase